jgi:hypothetical protein
MSNGFQLSKELGVKPDWNVRTESYTEQDIVEGIKDTVDAADSYEITSVPTPFARWHLIDQAFGWVADDATKNGESNLTGTTIYHKLVAEALDVAEVFFNYDGLKKEGKELEIRKVRLKTEVDTLLKSGDPRLKNLGETYKLFSTIHRDNDTKISMFDAEEINLLFYKGKMIGGTSPICMYFTSTDSNAELAFDLDNTTLFRAPHESLIERSQAFSFAQIALVRNNPGLSKYMPGFCKYIGYVDETLKTNVNATAFSKDFLTKAVITNDPEAPSVVQIQDGNLVRLYLPRKLEGVLQSDLVLGTYRGDFPEGQKRPLTLSPDYRERKFLFNEVLWNPEKLTRHNADEPILERRILPGTHHNYPWLTTSDLLESEIIRLLGPLDRERFQGNPGHHYVDNFQDEKGDYLLPIKPLFFKYFSREDLMGKIAGFSVFELNRDDKDRNVEVVLRIPIGESGDDFVTFKRQYAPNAHVSEKENQGAVRVHAFNLGLIPDVAAPVYKNGQVVVQEAWGGNPPATLKMAASWNQQQDKELKFVDTPENDPIVRKESDVDGTKVYRPASKFDMIRVVVDKAAGWLILTGVKNEISAFGAAFDLAIDFGTTNTHVALRERSKDKGSYESLSLSQPGMMLRTLFPYDYTPNAAPSIRTNLLLRSFFREIGDDNKYNFPARTVIAETQPVRDSEIVPVGRMNIPFYYQETAPPKGDTIHTDLKWSNLAKAEEKSRLNHYFACLLQLAVNEVICRGGDPSEIRMAFFYPSAMSIAHRRELESAWKKAFRDNCGNNIENVFEISESVAPYKFFTKAAPGMVTGLNVINCDIGGGTCDAYIQYKGEAKDPKIASFQFGGKAVFGDGYDRDGKARNGFATFCRDRVSTSVKSNKGIEKAYNDLSKNSSEEIVSFYLSLSNTKLHKGVQFDFGEFIRTERPQMQLVYLLYFSSIIYHLAQTTKSMGMEAPTTFNFTGNGSKIIQALARDSELATIAGYLVAGVYEEREEEGFKGLSKYTVKVHTHDKPKEYTCQGGLAILEELDGKDGEEHLTTPPKVVIMGDVVDAAQAPHYLIEGIGNYVDDKTPRNYGQLKDDRELRINIKKNVAQMLDILMEIDRKHTFENLFAIKIDDREAFRTEVLSYVDVGFINGLEETLDRVADDKMPDETLFFLPMRAVLYRLGIRLTEKVF